MEYVKAKTVLSARNKDRSFNGADFNINLYRGCSHGCIYCDSRSECYGIEDFDRVRAKKNALEILDDELSRKREKGVIGFGAMNDPYNPFEKTEKLSRGALEIIKKHGFGISLLTKSDLVTRDIDLFKEINKNSPCVIRMTVTAADDELCRKVEPHVSSSSERFSALQKIADEGIATSVYVCPVLPFITDAKENIAQIVNKACESGVRHIYMAFGVTVRQNQRVYFYNQLDNKFSGIKEKYIETFGMDYECPAPNYKELREVLESECKKCKIACSYGDIVEYVDSSVKQSQITFL